jgi:hypothetical protein
MAMVKHSDNGIELLGPDPEDFGFPAKPTRNDQRVWDTQQRFLRRYAERGKFVLSAADVGITPQAVYKWEHADKFGFNKRMEQAYQAYRETLEQQMDEFIDESKHNTQIAQIFRLKAAWPEKYQDDAKPVSASESRQLLDRLTEMARKEIEERKPLEEGATEGEFRDLGEADKS